MASADSICLQVSGASLRFGGLAVVNDVSFQVETGQIMGLVGPNGAGKTTLLNMISGLHSPLAGTIRYRGHEITGWAPHRIAGAGISRTFQNMRLFHDMTALENVMVGRHSAQTTNLVTAVLRLRREREEEQYARTRATTLLKSVGLEDRADVWVDEMSYGQQRRVELARALALEPKLLLLDEPTAGLPSSEIDRLSSVLNQVRNAGCTILLIEHNMRFVAQLCDHLVVLNFGNKIAEGVPDEVLRSIEVRNAYLGDEPA